MLTWYLNNLVCEKIYIFRILWCIWMKEETFGLSKPQIMIVFQTCHQKRNLTITFHCSSHLVKICSKGMLTQAIRWRKITDIQETAQFCSWLFQSIYFEIYREFMISATLCSGSFFTQRIIVTNQQNMIILT